ncbi:CheR family methyltransferase [Marinobacterium litorale]|uniref:CheR family methyltransferase n=1 Tax=Marinobacterium litorale TaxID=404770 RepID=UPI00040EC2A6|nr:protein-glutamate O-methyltransferase CheR [Marinobacterium litorale]
MHDISDDEFEKFARLLQARAGIHLTERKKVMLATRLERRLNHYGFDRFGQYYRLVTSSDGHDELQVMIDHLTTNETHFFREPEHFRFLANTLREQRFERCRVWCAASSSGEEVYTLAMVLDDVLGAGRWQLLGSDISTRVLERARKAIYPEEDNLSIPPYYLKRYCLQGVGQYDGSFTIDRKIRGGIEFRQINLTEALPSIGSFDFIFIRNVMIYFDQPTKQQVVANVLKALKPGGYIITSHSESLHGVNSSIRMVRPSVYRKEDR